MGRPKQEQQLKKWNAAVRSNDMTKRCVRVCSNINI